MAPPAPAQVPAGPSSVWKLTCPWGLPIAALCNMPHMPHTSCSVSASYLKYGQGYTTCLSEASSGSSASFLLLGGQGHALGWRAHLVCSVWDKVAVVEDQWILLFVVLLLGPTACTGYTWQATAQLQGFAADLQ